jgi:PAS domain S-box-containing protein
MANLPNLTRSGLPGTDRIPLETGCPGGIKETDGPMTELRHASTMTAYDRETRRYVRAVNSPASDEQFPYALLEALAAAIYVTDAEGRITFYNEAAAELWGCRPELGSARWCGSWRLFWPDGRPMAHDQCPMATALKEGRAVRGAEAVAERPDGTRVPFIPLPTPLRDAAGALVGAVNVLVDISERKRATEAERWLAAAIESSDDAIVTKNLDGIIASWNRGAELLFGYTAAEAVGQPITMLIPDDRQDEEPSIIARIRRGERIHQYETVRRRKDGALIDISLTISPVKNADGRIVGASKIARDITERKQADRRMKLLAAEVDHRAKNILATVQAVASSTEADSVPEFVETFMGRLQSIARAHALLTEGRWKGAELKRLLEEELAPFRSQTADRVSLFGPPVALPPGAAETLSMTLHELATNAAKYGALSVPAGRLSVEWSRDVSGHVVLRWIETGGPPVQPPSRQGFGTRLIARTADHLGGEGRLEWPVSGLVYEIAIPAGKLAY